MINMSKFRRVYPRKPFVYKEYSFCDKGESRVDPKVLRISLVYTETMDYDIITFNEELSSMEGGKEGVALDVSSIVGMGQPLNTISFKFESNKRAQTNLLKQFIVDTQFYPIQKNIEGIDELINIDTYVLENILTGYQVTNISDWVKI